MELENTKGECFVISPIGSVGSEERRKSDKVLRHLISPVVESLGYKCVRADRISEPGIITSQVIQHVIDAPLVVADLSGHNPNVLYELAIRHVSRKPLVQLIARGESIPFDVAVTRTIQFELSDLDSVEDAKGELQKQIKSMESGKSSVETPISIAVDLQILKSGSAEQRSTADLIVAMAGLRGEMNGLRESMRNFRAREEFRRRVVHGIPPREVVMELEFVEDEMKRLANDLSKLSRSKTEAGKAESEVLSRRLRMLEKRRRDLLSSMVR